MILRRGKVKNPTRWHLHAGETRKINKRKKVSGIDDNRFIGHLNVQDPEKEFVKDARDRWI